MTINIAVSNYIPLGVIGWFNTGSAGYFPYSLNTIVTTHELTVGVYNTLSRTVSNCKISVIVLYVKNL